MKVSLNDVKDAFNAIISGGKDWKKIASWASKVLLARDLNDLEYESPSDETKIFNALKYLTEVASQDINKTYPHSIETLIEYKNKHGLSDGKIKVSINKLREIL